MQEKNELECGSVENRQRLQAKERLSIAVGPNDAKEALHIPPIYPYLARMHNKTISETRTMNLKARNVNTCQ